MLGRGLAGIFVLAGSVALLAAQPLDIFLALETSEGTEQAIGLLRPKALGEGDRAGVAGFSFGSPRLLQALTEDRERITDAIGRAAFRISAAAGGIRTGSGPNVSIAAAIKLSCEELRRDATADRRRAILLVFGGEDPELGRELASVKAALDAADARLYAVLADRTNSSAGPPQGRLPRTIPIAPVMTAQRIAELAEASGGKLFRGAWDWKEILREARR